MVGPACHPSYTRGARRKNRCCSYTHLAKTKEWRVAMTFREWPTIFACCLVACASNADREDAKYAEAVARLDSTIRNLGEIQSAVVAVLSRRRVQLRVPQYQVPLGDANTDFVPSDLVRRVDTAARTSNHVDAALVAMLQDANSGAPIRQTYESGCSREGDLNGDVETIKTDVYKLPVSRQLDAVALIYFLPCIVHPSQQINSPSATQPTDTNSKAVAASAQRKRDEALNKPFQIPSSERISIIDGQVFRFSATDDRDIPVPTYVTRILAREGARLVGLYQPIAKNSFKEFVFDRYTIAAGAKEVQQTAKGWFNGLGLNGTVYISPTFARAAVVACTGKVEYLPSLRARLVATERPWLADRRLTYSDVRGITEMAERNVSDMNSCIAQQGTFLLAHELAHAILEVGEGPADCIAIAMLRLSGQNDMGIFKTVIFDSLDSSRDSILRLDEKETRLLRERRNQIDQFLTMKDKEPSAILSACSQTKVTS